MYLDDGWASHNECTCRLVSKKGSGRFVKRRIGRFYLGLGKGSVEIHEKKCVALKDNISFLLYGKEVVSARNLARTVGRIISMSFALGNICQIMTRNLHVPIQSRVSWDKPVILDKLVFDELLLWSNNLDTLPFRSLAPVFRVPERILFTDATVVVLQMHGFI